MSGPRSRRKTLWGFLWLHRKIAFCVTLIPYLFPFLLCYLLEPELAGRTAFWTGMVAIVVLKGTVWIGQCLKYPWYPSFMLSIKRKLLKKGYHVDFWLDGKLETGILMDDGKEKPGWRQIHLIYRSGTVWVPENKIFPALRYDLWKLEQNH